MDPKNPIPGILWVNSDVINPDKLSRQDFDSWYIDEHIPDVVAKSGVQSARRYEHVEDEDDDGGGGGVPTRRLGYLTIYQMPDLNFMQTAEFKGLEGQSPGPNQERIFKNAEFDTRAYERVSVVGCGGVWGESSGKSTVILCVAMSGPLDKQLSETFQSEHVKDVSKCSGYQCTNWYNLSSRSVLSAFERLFPAGPTLLAIHEFNGSEPPWKELSGDNVVEWVTKYTPGAEDVDFGWFKLMKEFEKVK